MRNFDKSGVVELPKSIRQIYLVKNNYDRPGAVRLSNGSLYD